jgi:hypothetical protein
MLIVMLILMMMMIRKTKFYFKNRFESRFENRSDDRFERRVLFFLHCWVRNKSRKKMNKAWQRVWSTSASAWSKRMKFRRFSSISSFSFFVDVYDSFCFEHHEILYILRILFWWWTFDKRFFDALTFRIDRILRSKDIDFRCDHIVSNCSCLIKRFYQSSRLIDNLIA